MKAINICAVLLLRYSTDFVEGTKFELVNLDRRTRKEFNLNGGHHPRVGVARLYLPRKETGGRKWPNANERQHEVSWSR